MAGKQTFDFMKALDQIAEDYEKERAKRLGLTVAELREIERLKRKSWPWTTGR